MGAWNRRKKYQPVQDNGQHISWNVKLTRFLKKEMTITALAVFAVMIVILGSAYAVFTSVNRSSGYNTIQVGTLAITYDDTSSGLGNTINLASAYPVADATGQASTPYKFKITNTGTLPVNYTIKIQDDTTAITNDKCSSNQLDKAYIKYSIDGGTPVVLSTKSSSSYLINSGTLAAGASKTIQLRMWIASNATNSVLGKHYHGKVVIDGSQQ